MKQTYEAKLLKDWESIFQQGLLTFWVFVALNGEALTTGEIKAAVSELTRGTYNTSEQSLYRVLRKYYDLELVDYSELDSPNGPKRKLYKLSSLGERVLRNFAKRNISLFMNDDVQNLLTQERGTNETH